MANDILLTGGTGFIGSNLCENLLKLNKNVILIKRSFSDTWKVDDFKSKYPNITLIDIDQENLEDVFSEHKIEGILHLAAYYKKYHETKDINTMIETNLNFPTHLLEYGIKNNVKYFINTGTFFEYSFNKLPVIESTTNKSFNLYSATKLAFEDILKYYNDSFGLKTATLRLFTPYGPKDDENKLIPYLILNILKGNEIKLNNPNQTLDPVFVEDISKAFISCINNYEKFNEYEIFNVATGVTYTIQNIYENIKNRINKNKNVQIYNKSNPICNPEKAEKILNWKYETELINGIESTIKYYNTKYNIKSDL